jgi:hypothetical protein
MLRLKARYEKLEQMSMVGPEPATHIMLFNLDALFIEMSNMQSTDVVISVLSLFSNVYM